MKEAEPMSMTVLNRTQVMLFLSGTPNPPPPPDMLLVFLNLSKVCRMSNAGTAIHLSIPQKM